MQPVVRLLNLDRSAERLASFRAENPGLQIDRVRAVDGRLLSRDTCIRSGLIGQANTYSSSAIGIAASHVGLWQECALGTAPFHIAEDDAIFHNSFASIANSLLGGLGHWDVVFWGFNFDWPIQVELTEAIGPTVMQFDQDSLIAATPPFEEPIKSLRDTTMHITR